MPQEYPPELEHAEEDAIATALAAHAPTDIEVEGAWAAVRSRLPLANAAPASAADRVTAPRSWRPVRRGWRAAAVLVAATCVLGVALGGAGLIRERTMALDPGMQRIADEHLYQEIGQTRQADGVTITVTAAYLDRGRSVIYYTVALAPVQRATYTRADLGSWSLTDQAGAEPEGTGGLGTCEPWPSDGSPMHCYLLEGPMPEAANARTVVLQLVVSRVYLQTSGRAHAEATGPWSFAFSAPYHDTNIGSVMQFFPHLLHLVPGQQP